MAENEIHLWLAPLGIGAAKIAAIGNLLQPDESERAARFRFPEHREHFTAARGILRSILGLHLGCPPESIRFAYGEHGKPSLAQPAGTHMEFNLSHSGGFAIYAVVLGRQVGVDLERIKAEGSWMEIARQYFAATEAAELEALAEEAMRNRFFELWSAKEACQKALGMGLRFPLDKNSHPALTVINLDTVPGYSAALAFEAGDQPAIIKRLFTA
ncbi:MAG TPA: 4'-phosphopantetheinyl transferase superfamily protein [Chthoniobacteraceae bacterium]|nr:4'-phosphopantetheinyl transferase superfamily protein [Chthoniobacteraceae bacterium]